MPASRTSSEGSNSSLIAMVIFIIVSLIASVFGIIMYLNNEKLRTEAERAQNELNDFGTASERRQVQSLMPKGSSRVTVLRRLTSNTRYLCTRIGGEELAEVELARAKYEVDNRLQPLQEQLGLVLVDKEEEAVPEQGLASIIESLIQENELLRKGNEELTIHQNQQDQMVADMQSQMKALEDRLAADMQQASSAAQTNNESYSRLMDDMSRRYEEQIRSISDEKDQLQTENDSLNQQVEMLISEIDKHQAKIMELQKLFKEARPTPDMDYEAVEPDGKVVSVNLSDGLVYINLARNDRIYRGLTFTVYDSYQSIPKSGEGKGTIEVKEIMDTISKCQITSFDPTNPIMKGDLVANLIWNKEKTFQFCVIGDFDLNGDGVVDPDGREKIVNLITGWGGRATSSLSVDTDFLVLGRKTEFTQQLSQEEIDARTDLAMAYLSAKAKADEYDRIVQEGAMLGVPTFNTSRFLHFIGYQ